MATEIKDQLKNIEIDSIRYHLLKKEFTQIVMTGDVQNPVLDTSQMDPKEQINWEIRSLSPSGFLAGVVFRIHEKEQFCELIYFVVNQNFQRMGLGSMLMDKFKSYL